MATETATVAVAQTGETQNTEVALTATPDTEAYNTVIEMLKSRELELSVTQLELLESVTRQMLDRNSALEKKCTHQLLNHTELSCTTAEPLYLCRTTRPTATTKCNSFGLGLLVAQKTGYESTDDVWIGVLSPNSVFPGLSTAHYAYSETELRLYSQPLQRVTAEYTHLTGRQVDYPVFLSLPLTLSDLALATGEIPTEWFDRSLCNLWTDLRSALLYSALQLWKGQENFQKYSTEPLRVTAVWLERAKLAGLKQFNRGYFSHSYVNATGAVNFELTDLETESSQTFQTAYTLADFADPLSKELNGTRYCNAHRRFLFGHLPLTQFQMEKAGLASTPAELKKFTWDYNYGSGIAALPITETGTDLKVDIQISGLALSSTDTVITVKKAD